MSSEPGLQYSLDDMLCNMEAAENARKSRTAKIGEKGKKISEYHNRMYDLGDAPTRPKSQPCPAVGRKQKEGPASTVYPS